MDLRVTLVDGNEAHVFSDYIQIGELEVPVNLTETELQDFTRRYLTKLRKPEVMAGIKVFPRSSEDDFWVRLLEVRRVPSYY